MNMNRIILLLFLMIAISYATIRNTMITRVVKLESQLSEQSLSITFLNGGAKAINTYTHIVPVSSEGRLCYIGAESEKGENLVVNKLDGVSNSNEIRYTGVIFIKKRKIIMKKKKL